MKLTVIAASTLLLSVAGCCSGTNQYLCRSRQAEAKSELAAFMITAQSYKADKGQFPKTLAESGYHPLNAKYYDISVVSSSATSIVAQATGKEEAAGDVWRINEKGAPTAVTDQCH